MLKSDVMKKYKNVLLSLGFFILAPVWYFLVFTLLNPYVNAIKFPPSLANEIAVWPYIIFFIMAMFFGSRDSTGTPSVIGRIVLIIGIVVLLIPLLYFYWAAGWSA